MTHYDTINYIKRWKAAHGQKLERWLGADMLARISEASKDFYAEIPLAGVPGHVQTYRGDFFGDLDGAGGFTSLSDLIAEVSAGKGQYFSISKSGFTGVVGISTTMWTVGSLPPAGATAPALPAGASPDQTTIGGFRQTNAAAGDTLHFLNATLTPSVGGNLLLLYDRYFHGNWNLATTPQSVTGVPTRYQNAVDSIGNFITMHVTTALGTGTPTATVTYVDQDNNAAEAAAAQTIVGSSIVGRFPFAQTVGGGWFIPLNAADRGVRSITNLSLSAASTGNVDVVLGKPIAFIPQPTANTPFVVDGVNTMMSLRQIPDNSCLAFIEIQKGSTAATTYNGMVTLASG